MNDTPEQLKKQKYNTLFMDMAERVSLMSHAVRLKVGSVLVKDNNIISFGWNGMPAGWDNDCEYKEYPDKWIKNDYVDLDYPLQDENGDYYRLKTRPEVLHSEANCLLKLAKSTVSSIDSTLFCTHAPCIDCAKLIHQSGINSVYYRNAYRSDAGITFLEKSGTTVQQL
jgi:dCMP deaminase